MLHLPQETLSNKNVPEDKLVDVMIKGPSKNVAGACAMIYYSIYNTQRKKEGQNKV
eukprot:UN05984